MVALREQISALEKSSMSYDSKLRELTRAHKEAEREVAKFDKTAKKLREVAKVTDLWKGMRSSALKFAKYGAIEFGVMTAALGALKLALVTGQYVMKGFRASLTGLGAAAGVAVAAVSALLGGMRELQVAQMKGSFRAAYQNEAVAKSSPTLAWESGRSDYSRSAYASSRLLMGDQRLGMFSDKALQQAMTARLNAGQQINAQFRNQLVALGDYTGGDEKAMVNLSKAMAEGAKAGKITQSVYDDLIRSSPVLQKAFEEMTGGQKQAEAAAKAGSVSFEKFQQALISGDLKALKPYKGTLDEINNTVFGKFKGGLRVVKEALSEISMVSSKNAYGTGPSKTILDAIKEPIDGIVNGIQGALAAIGPSLRKSIPNMLAGGDTAFDKAMERFVFYTVKGMTALDGLSVKMNSWVGTIRKFFGVIGDYIRSVTGPFDRMYQSFLKPLAMFLVGTLNTALKAFGGALDAQQRDIAAWGAAMQGLGKFVKLFFDALNVVKAITTPLVTFVVELASGVGELYENFGAFKGILKGFAAFALLRWGFLKGLIGLWQKWKLALHETLSAFQKGASNVEYFRAAVVQLTAAIERLNAAQAATGSGVGGYTPLKAKKGARQFAPISSGSGLSPIQGGPGFRYRGTLPMSGISAQQRMPITSQYLPSASPVGSYFKTMDQQAAALGMSRSVAPGGLAGFRGWASGKWAQASSKLGGFSRFMSPSRSYRSDAFNALSAEEQQKIRDADAAKSAKAANLALGLTVVGGMMQQSKNSMVSGAGETTSMAGMGGMMAPMLGISGPAGMAIGATIGLGGAIAKRTPKTSGRGQSLGRGLQGAGAGAALGTMIAPGVGTAIGTVAGGIIGATVGGIMAMHERARLRDKSETDARSRYSKNAINSRKEFSDRVTGQIREKYRLRAAMKQDQYKKKLEDQLAGVGGRNSISPAAKALKAQIAELDNDRKQYDDLRKRYYDLGRALKGANRTISELKDRGTQLENNFKAGNFFGFKAKQLAAYADRHGMDLSKINLSIKALIQLSGYSGDAADAMANLGLAAKRLYTDLTEQLKTQKDAVQTSLDAQTAYAEYGRTMSSGGYGSPEATTIATTDVIDKIVAAQTGVLASGAFTGTRSVLGPNVPSGLRKIEGLQMGNAFAVTPFQQYVDATTGEFTKMAQQLVQHGADPTELNKQVETALAPIATKNEAGQWIAKTDMATQLRYNPLIAQTMGTASSNFENAFTGLSPDQLSKGYGKGTKLGDQLDFATASTVSALRAQGVTGDQKTLENQVRNSFIGQLEAKGVSTNDKIKKAFDQGSKQTKERIEKGFEDATTRFKGKFSFKVDKKAVEVTMGDTTTARYGRTLAAHAMLNRQLPGNRTITSGVRDWGLGSINSDHLTGAAYDLTGNYLGSYATLVRRNGGFAEFHGGSLNRHLHVVPGPGPIGDTLVARAPGMTRGGGGNVVSHNYSIMVNAPEGSSPGAIADAVMARIRREQRDAMERA